MTCEQCGQAEATLMRRGGGMWNPICGECAEWYNPDRIEPLSEVDVIEDEVALTLMELDTATGNY